MIVNTAVKWYLSYRWRRIQALRYDALELQSSVLHDLLDRLKDTEYGRRYDANRIEDAKDFRLALPLVEYDHIKVDVRRMMHGERDVLWPGQVSYFAKSSGTTQDRSKYIPFSDQFIKMCSVRTAWDTLNVYYQYNQDATIFRDKSLILCGSVEEYEANPECKIGDVSAIMMYRMPLVGRPYNSPDLETALIQDWDEKIDTFVQKSIKDDLVFIAGVPSWMLVLMQRVKAHHGLDHLHEIWPNLKLYVHGGVKFGPYRKQFEQLLPGSGMTYMEAYNASEGYFGFQDDYERDDLLLLTDNGIYYEFIPLDAYPHQPDAVIGLADVETDVQYVIIISTASGLWRYVLGDTICFTQIQPYRFVYTGRTAQNINVFGEELMIDNADKAIERTSISQRCVIREYTVAPVFLQDEKSGAHQWLVEFVNDPDDMDAFAECLDENLKEINSDYAAKRSGDMVLHRAVVTPLPKGSFMNWMAKKGKIGGQNKVPRLSNDRSVVNDILQHVQQMT